LDLVISACTSLSRAKAARGGAHDMRAVGFVAALAARLPALRPLLDAPKGAGRGRGPEGRQRAMAASAISCSDWAWD
jgi:hypothetical protein